MPLSPRLRMTDQSINNLMTSIGQRKIHDRIPSCLMVVCCLGIRRLLGHLLLCDAWVILAMFCAGVFGSIAPLRRGDAQPSAARSVSNSQSRWKIRVSQPKIGG
ncbi:hypothetical protein BO99DRAFT_189784 [Aspergillus violaceofuscus CBS 115571]|uniref:Uncharacterized protein n=1 Tax=Aspergillus violaceofuscus (strain CBS 115571) TaxID=1450538 RepID=A0A2V5H1D0_ASPV1|nr:hypothetical protein BO99DRAFT_189784 [Aspergillus violaceofuscus CBS 115571]